MYERPWNKQEELWEVLWQTFPEGEFKEPAISYKQVEGIQPSQPAGKANFSTSIKEFSKSFVFIGLF